MARERLVPREAPNDMYNKLMAIVERSALIPTDTDLTEDEILGYDEFGIPSK